MIGAGDKNTLFTFDENSSELWPSFKDEFHRYATYTCIYIDDPALLNLLNEMGKSGKIRRLETHLISFFVASLTNSIVQEHKC